MAFVTSKASGEDVNIYYEDLGKGKPVLMIHGWPVSGAMFEYQITEMLPKGYRCITYDRRGFGHSDKPAGGYDYKTMAADLKAVIDATGASDITLVGFSMAGGEIAKYFSEYGGAKVSKVVLVAAITPFMLKTADNPTGVPQEVFDGMAEKLKADRPGFLEGFNKDFYGVGFLQKPVSSAMLQAASNLAMHASPIATLECAKAFSSTDLREDCKKINVPTLIIHGDADKTVPIEASAKQAVKLIPNATLKVYEGEPHGLFVTAKEQLNADLMAFAG